MFVNSNHRWLQFILLLTIPVCMLESMQAAEAVAEAVSQGIVSFYAQHCNPDYPEKFVETACLKIVKERGEPYLQQQYNADLLRRNLYKSDILKQINGFCTTLANIYIHNSFFKKSYAMQLHHQDLKDWFAQDIITAARLLDVYEQDRKLLTQDYATKPMDSVRVINGKKSVAYELYVLHETKRLYDLGMRAADAPVTSALNLDSYLKDKHLSGFLKYIQGFAQDSFNPTLYCMSIEVVRQQSGLPTQEWSTIEYNKVCGFYNSIDLITGATKHFDFRYKNFVEPFLLTLVSKRVFDKSLFDRDSVGGQITRTICKSLFADFYAQWLVKKFDDTVCFPMLQDYQRVFKQQYDCFSQDGRAILLLRQRERETDQWTAEKVNVAMGLIGAHLLGLAHKLKKEACVEGVQTILAQREKLQADSKEWGVAVEHVENCRLAYEKRLHEWFALLEQKNNIMREHRLETLNFVARQLEQKNSGLQQQREQNRLRALLNGWSQEIKRNRIFKEDVSPDTISNSSEQQSVPLIAPVQQGEIRVRRHDPYAVGVLQKNESVGLPVNVDVPMANLRKIYFNGRPVVGVESDEGLFLMPYGIQFASVPGNTQSLMPVDE